MRVFQNFRGRRRVFLGFFEGFLLALEKILKIDRVQPLVFLKDQDFEPPNFLAIKFLIRLRRRIYYPLDGSVTQWTDPQLFEMNP